MLDEGGGGGGAGSWWVQAGGGSGFGGKADPEVCQYLWCHNTNLRGGGGGGMSGGDNFGIPKFWCLADGCGKFRHAQIFVEQ